MRKGEKSRGQKSKHQGTATCWGRGGRRPEEEEPAKKQKWLEWWQVVWAGKSHRRQGRRERGLRHQCEMSERGKENGWQEELNKVIFLWTFLIHGLFWSAWRGSSDLGTWQMWAHRVVHAGILLWKGCHHIREGIQSTGHLCLHCLLITGLVSLE